MAFNFDGDIPNGVSIEDNAIVGRNIGVKFSLLLNEANLFQIQANKMATLYSFKQMVQTNGPMDYKKLDKESIDKGQKSKYEDFGNFNYGVVARSAGITEELALASASAYQARNIFIKALTDKSYFNNLTTQEKEKYGEYLDIVKKLRNENAKDGVFYDKLTEYFLDESYRIGKETGNFGYFDDPKDQEFIKQGYKQARENGYGNDVIPIAYYDLKSGFGFKNIYNLFFSSKIDNIDEIRKEFEKLYAIEYKNNKGIIQSLDYNNTQQVLNTLIGENIPKKAQAEFLKQEDLKESEKNLFSKVFDNVSDKVKTLTEKKLDLNNLMQGVKSNAMDAILNSAFIKALLAMFGVKEERFKELFQGLFDKVGGFDQAMNNSFSFGMNNANAQQIDFSNYIWKGNTAGCRQFCDGEMSLNQRGYNRLLGMVQQGKMSQEMFNYCCHRNPVRQDMNEFYADMKAGLGDGVANIMMQMAKAESGLGKNIMNKEAAGAAGELQLIRSNAIAFGKRVWGANHSNLEILKRYDEDPKFRNQVAIEFCKEQLKALKPPTAEGIRAVWFLGVGGGPRFLRAYHANPNMSVANIFDEQVMKQNGMNASWTLKDCYNKFIANAGFGSSQRLDVQIPSQNYANNQNYNEEQSVGQKA